jgi:hypothetical protein
MSEHAIFHAKTITQEDVDRGLPMVGDTEDIDLL